MKKLYFFIFMIVMALSQTNAVNAKAYKLVTGKVYGAPVAQTITFPAFTAAQTAGFADITLTATASSALPITYTSSNTAVATIVAGKIHYIGIGSAVITATQPGDNVNWLPATSVSLPLTVNPTITFANLGNVAFTPTDITLAATSNAAVGTWPITYTTSDATIATIVAGKLHCVGLGTVTITAAQQGSVYPGVAYTTTTKTATVTLTLGAAPVITWTGSAGTALQSADLVLGGTSTNTNTAQFPIIYTITPANPNVATIVNNRLHMTGTGTVTIIATQPGSGKFTDAAPASANFVITAPAAPTFSTALGGKVFGTTLDFDPAATQGGWASTITYTSSNPALATIVNNKIHLVSGPITAGTVTIGASYTYPVGTGGTASTAVTNNTTLAATVATAPTSPVLTFTALGSKAYTTIDIPLVATTTSTSATPITFAITGGNTALATIVNGNLRLLPIAAVPVAPNNTVIVTASQGGSAYIAGAIPAPVSQTLTLTAPTIAITNPGTKLTNASDFAVATTATIPTVPVTVTIDAATPAGLATIINGNVHLLGGTGNVTLRASQSAAAIAAGYPPAADVTAVFAVNAPTNPVITFAALAPRPYANGTTTLTATSTVASPAVTFTSSNPAVATITSAGVLTLTGAVAPPNNFTIITASQGGGTGGAPGLAADVQNVLTVTPATITFPTIGTKAYVASDFAPGATSTNTAAFIYYTSSNPAVATVVNNVTGTLTGGTGYTNGTYNNIALVGGSGTGAVASTLVVAGGIVTSVTINTTTVYNNGDILTLAVPGSIGGGNNFSFLVTGFNSVVRYNKNVPAAPNNTTTITASQGGGVNGTLTLAPDVSQVLTVTGPVITFPPLGTKQFTSTDINPGATTTYVSTNSITSTTLVAGSGYTPGTYFSVPLTGGTGTGATANITVVGTIVTSVVLVNPGIGYTVNNVLTASNTLIGGTGNGFSVIVSGISAGLPITYTSSNTAVATIVNGFIHFVGTAPGNNTTVITASVVPPAGVNLTGYALPAPVPQTLTVISPTITFNALGSRTFSTTDVNPGATSSLTNTVINYTSSNTAVATINNAGASAGTFTRGSDYTPGTYTNVPLTGGTGTGATGTIIVGPISSRTQTTAGVTSVTFVYGVQSVNLNSAGSGYSVGDVLTCPNTSIGGTGTGFGVTVSGIGSYLHYVGVGTTNITASQGGGATGTVSLPADVTQSLTVVAPTLTFPALGSQKLPVADFAAGATSTLNTPISYTSSTAAVATVLTNSILQLSNISFNGSGYQNGVYPLVPLTGGSGTGALATLTVIGNAVTGAVITSGGTGYVVGDNLSVSNSFLGNTGLGFAISPSVVGGAVTVTGSGTTTIKATQGGGATGLSSGIISFILANGTGYTNGLYTSVALSGGSGTGATANILVSGGKINTVSLTNAGTGYKATDVLTCAATSIGGTGAGFNITVTAIGPIAADVSQTLTILPNTISFPALGTKILTNVDFTPNAISTYGNAAITYTSSNPAVATIVNGNIHYIAAGTTNITASQGGGATGTNGSVAGFNTAAGTNYTNGTYTGVPLTAGTGTGAVATIIVSGGKIASVAITSGGNGYTVNDILTTAAANIGNTGTGFSITVTSTSSLPADAVSALTVASPVITFTGLFGTKTTLSSDFAPGATSTIASPAIAYTSSNTAVATIIPGSIFSTGTITPGVNYISGTYNNVSLTGGTGTGAKANIVIIGGGVSSLTLVTGGTGYVSGDVISATPASLGGVGTGFSFTATAGPVIHPVGAGTTTIEATQQGSAVGTVAAATATLPADVTASLTLTTPAINFPALGTKAYSNVDILPGASSPVTTTPIVYTSSNTAVATIVSTLTLNSTFNIGSGYTNGTYNNVTLLGGSGLNGAATIVVANGSVASVRVTSNGTGGAYNAGDVLTVASSALGGTGTGFSIGVNGFDNFIHFVAAGTTTIKASQGGGATGTNSLPADVSQVLTVTAPTITFPALGSVAYSNIDIAPGATSSVTLPITYTSATPTVAVITSAGQIRMLKAGTSIITASQGGGTTGTATIPADVSQVLTVTGGPAITFAALGSKPLSSADFAPGATSTVTTTPITYTSSNTAVATIVGGNIHYVGLGTSTITASQGGGVSGTATLPPDQTQVLTVTAPVITFTTTQLPATKAIQSVDLAPGATSTVTTVPITYTSSDPTIATIVNGNIHFVGGIGSTVIRATQQGTAATSALAPATATLPADVQLTLTVTAPVITFTTTQLPATLPFATLDRLPGATSTLSNVAITYTSSDPNVATIVNGNIHFVGLGSTTITASQQTTALAAGYLAPADVSLQLAVTAPTLTMTALGSKAFTSTDLPLLNTVTGTVNQSAPITFTSSDPTVATIVNNQLRYVGIGNCVITATQAAVPGAGAPAVATSTLTVTPAVLTVAPAIGTTLINAVDVQLAYTSTISTSTFPVTYTSSDPTVATVVGGLLHVVGAGTAVITGNQVTNTNYQPLPTLSTLTVTQVPVANTPTISFTALGTRQYSNNGDITPVASSTLGTALTFTSSNPAVATIVNGLIHLTPPSIVNGVVTYPNPNTAVITASQGGGINGVPGLLPADVSTVLTVVPAGISFPPLGVQRFNTTDLNPGATSSYIIINSNNIVQPITYTSSDPTVATIVNGNIHFVGLGTTTITASMGNVIVPDVSQTITVVAPAITFAATASKAYSTTDVAPGATSTLATAPITYTSSNPSVATIVNGNIHFTGVGQTTITASQAAVGNSTAPLNAAQVLTVTAPTLTFAATRTIAFTLTDQDPAATSTLLTTPITYTSSNPALVSIVNNKLHFNIPTSNLTNNTAIITATQVGESNVPVQTALQTLTVTQALIFPNVMIKAYGDPDFAPAFSTFGSGYPVTYSSATTTVATTVTSNGIPNSLVHIVGPGTSVITASQAGDGNTAAATNATATLTVTQAPMTITPKNVTIAYGTTGVPVLPVNYFGFKSASGNAPLDDSTKFTTQPTVYIVGRAFNGNYSTLPVGTYTLFAAGAASTLYTFTYGTATLTVVAPVQTLTWVGNDQLPVAQQAPINKAVGDADFDPLARSTGDPIVYTSLNPSVATVTANGLIHIVGAGTATIRATLNTSSGNYVNSLTLPNNLPIVLTKTLIVAKGKQTITVATIPFLIRGSTNAYTPTASSSSGLAVKASVVDASFLSVVNNTLLPLHVGTTKVSFTQAGDANYAAADTVNVYVKVIDPAGADLLVHQAVSPDGDNINDFLYIEGITDYPVNHVKIIDRNGGNVFETDNYDNKTNVFTGKAKNGNKLPGGTYFFIVDYNVGNQRNHVTGYFVLKY
ncbi:gliding motility-associated C-terminal domain-containing protein [Mucilaginibacter sp. HMF5004]|uniref:beta strand repeat-containing protein n=1 Tax=Mucilaginibacter rivuli TaxID=2857527 RepID=UPI001C5DC75C|nr:gliding motility-associated C-terminal domain-containing protein [Mucilaginibacter rivuli]MBW4891061.1 gliding motility-associated C-terminal domain-containing protein [Mucilaginibacter rivuli]